MREVGWSCWPVYWPRESLAVTSLVSLLCVGHLVRSLAIEVHIHVTVLHVTRCSARSATCWTQTTLRLISVHDVSWCWEFSGSEINLSGNIWHISIDKCKWNHPQSSCYQYLKHITTTFLFQLVLGYIYLTLLCWIAMFLKTCHLGQPIRWKMEKNHKLSVIN